MFKFFRRAKLKGKANRDTDYLATPEAPEIDPNSPLGHNQRLFEKFDKDIETGNLPKVHQPTKRQIAECEERRREQLKRVQAEYDAEEEHEPWGVTYSLTRIQANQEIPVDVELWVDAVCDHYLKRAEPMMGMVHWEKGVRKRLYASRGYEWYSIQEIYPLIHFD